jgi:uncharacterized phage protein (TIGR01671 family)
MREIKFKRAFFKDEAKTEFSHFDIWGVGLGYIAFKSPSSNNFAQFFIDCQYTGLKDRNGKEIYEGDIVDFQEDGTFHKAQNIPAHLVVKYAVDFDIWSKQASFVMESIHPVYKEFEKKTMKTIDQLNEIYAKSCEVIGNIHENKDLLK